MNILLVDDSEEDIEITTRLFEKSTMKHVISIARNGREAIELLQLNGRTPDLILLDIQMPKLNGFECLAKLKKNDSTNHIPVIMLSSSRNQKDILKSYQLGASGYIPKPLLNEDFSRVIEAFNTYWQFVQLPTKST